MESSSKDKYCNDCKSFKSSSEFISYGSKGITKQLKTSAPKGSGRVGF